MILQTLGALIIVVALGCQHERPEASTAGYSSEELAALTFDQTINAQVAPPAGWTPIARDADRSLTSQY